jgi:dynein heavy chain 1
VLRKLIRNKVSSPRDFGWLYEMRFYWNPKEEPLKRLQIQVRPVPISQNLLFYCF